MVGRAVYIRVYYDVAYQLKQFAKNQHDFVEKKQIYICIGIGKFRFCKPRHTNGKHIISLPYSFFGMTVAFPRTLTENFCYSIFTFFSFCL
jgi:hypothetical protein